ncbi:putative mitochondrial protein [Dendrobium catenatum]|uniref:Putative mitochondrial protein n=1 Tax=Dendrobium catenatum TaxID=906689 RepID=A0A2I0VSH9_9ASPA|nr:putative mitochondrial protein [Dendrobium catenatum]
MAVKLDIEQDYDSMGWSALQQILVWYGFPLGFSGFVMECVLNVRFAIILNGKKLRWIEACSGFRQGCPLSPYLFIMCAQLLSNAIVQRGHSLGIQMASKGPRITHLLYADDVLIFSQATCGLARKMMKIIEDFCKWTGFRVNSNKSQILFGKAVDRANKKKLTRILSFKSVNYWKYLGIKMSLKRLKVADFQDLLAQVMEKLNVWGKKNLSLGGRIVLLKSSLLTLPNFVIMHLVVPKKVLQEIEKLCRNFVWHKSNGERGLHYVA